jgi:hypothetical protein
MTILAKKRLVALGLVTGMLATPAMGINVRKVCLANLFRCFVCLFVCLFVCFVQCLIL